MTWTGGSGADAPSVFLSYARQDGDVVREFADALERSGVHTLLDVDFLQPGQRWETVIVDHVRSADALVNFVSPASLGSRWVEAELVEFAKASDRPIIPVLIGGVDFDQLPPSLARYQAVRLGDPSQIAALSSSIAEIVKSEAVRIPPEPDKAEFHASQLAHDLAEDIRDSTTRADGDRDSDAVFLVHGHDHALRAEVEEHLVSIGIRPVVLSKVGAPSQSLFQKFETLARKARFAVVLLSADDLGASRVQYEHQELGGTKTLKYRARENVILELGFFYGRLGWERVFVVHKPAPQVWPDFERPSDLAGIVFVEVSNEYDWRTELTSSISNAGLTAVANPGAGADDKS